MAQHTSALVKPANELERDRKMNTLHCSTILDSVARYADRQLAASLKARTKDPAEASSPGPAFTGPLRRGSGGSNGTMVAAGEKSSGSLSHAIITRFTLLQNSLRQSAYIKKILEVRCFY
ncbi:hypothetical protein M5K25_018171 [Dendrobium thyrsiflorum]|uniref:Uncharacterized protein n=1 Tax=Dendrobium thyrsiflorum TaxID=117978 RepID=A0ABD0UI06_DENTH